MQPWFPSLTAVAVSLARGVGALPDRPSTRALRVLSLGLVDHVTLRMRAIDEVVLAALPRSRQLVILGAGLDRRASRLQALRDVVVYEVDHPATQASKRLVSRLTRAEGTTARFVGVDFERDSLDARLEQSGHDVHAETTWIWEGVTPYLTRDAFLSTLRIVAARSTPGSTLAMTYGTPELLAAGRRLKPFVRPAFAAIGEPLLGLMRPHEARDLVTTEGFDVTDDSGSPDWADRQGVPRPRVVVGERLLVAIRAGTTSGSGKP
ncbi:O-Methyltransferase involved in polyketide biosynthesis [Labilithrix luteola]|uniref:S-adenosyl-L-methionine-dependent methyltransferase n=1 Tax=Labilithrix luteola TaxID=1391654 RepID=A0A0K1QAY3_9BACT|nr:SAM-dependent methyltransferase [Labilithrix luteola]AKV02822.1 O-Methyltransferase involved in polyketide biosynthesis [Labilithrix luteola]